MSNTYQSKEVQEAYTNMTITLSSQIISATLAMLAVEGAFFTFIAAQKQLGFFFYFTIILSAICFVISIFIGGKAIDIIKDKFYDGFVSKSTAGKQFNFQAIFALAALLLFSINFLISLKLPPANNDLQLQVKTVQNGIQAIKADFKKLSNQDIQEQQRMDKFQRSLDKLDNQIQNLNKKVFQ